MEFLWLRYHSEQVWLHKFKQIFVFRFGIQTEDIPRRGRLYVTFTQCTLSIALPERLYALLPFQIVLFTLWDKPHPPIHIRVAKRHLLGANFT